MAEKRKRGQNFTADEKDKLIKLLLEHKNTILNRKTDGCTNEAKALAWNELTASFNALGSSHRSKESLMKVWDKMKSESKIYFAKTRKSSTQTGGGPSSIKTDPLLEQVCSIMGRGCTGIQGIYDSDAIDCPEESEPKFMCLPINPLPTELELIEDVDTAETCVETENIIEATPSSVVNESKVIRTPLWSRRRPVLSAHNERTQGIEAISTSFKNINKKKESVEDLKSTILQQELQYKEKLYNLQIEAASKDLMIKDLEIAIKKAVLEKIKGGACSTEL